MKDRIPPTVNPPQLLIISDSMRLKGIVVLFFAHSVVFHHGAEAVY